MRRHLIAYAVLAGVCLLALTPMLWKGIPSGHDFEFHMYSWMEVLSQWKQGIVYPRWAALAHWGYGEARFLFYPPASWALGAALGAILPWKLVPGAYLWLVLTLAGCSMYRLARQWLTEVDALFAAAFYAVNPYHLVIVYWRSALAELLAAALLPLLVVGILRLRQPGLRPILALSIVLAAAWLTNAPAAVMIHYSAAGLVIVLATRDRDWRLFPKMALAVALGAGLASFYLVPAVFEERWVNIGEVLAPGVRPQDNFLFTRIPDAEHNQFNLLVSTVAAVEIGALVAVIWFSRRWRSTKRIPWMFMTIWGAGAALLMISVTDLLWQYLPELRFVQLPWRWLLCLNAVLAILLTAGLRGWIRRGLTAGALIAVVVAGAYRIQQPWWDSAADVEEMRDAIAEGTGYEGTDEYVPAGADAYELNKDAPVVAASITPRSEILQWNALDKHILVRVDRSDLVTMRLFNYPAWEVAVNGKQVQTSTAEVTGQMQIPVAPGSNDIHIHFGRTRDRTIAGWISLVSLALLLAGWNITRLEPWPRAPVSAIG